MADDTGANPVAKRVERLRSRIRSLDDNGLDLLFREARTYRAWLDKPIPDALLHELHDLMRFGPTANNACPARLVFVKTAEGKERLKPCLMAGNVDKTMSAPATAIIAYDLKFFEKTPAPDPGLIKTFAEKPEAAERFALRNGSLQGAYLMLAARALGLDCGPMSGFYNAKCDEEFFAGTSIRSNFLCNLGYGDPSGMPERGPRFDFDDVARIV